MNLYLKGHQDHEVDIMANKKYTKNQIKAFKKKLASSMKKKNQQMTDQQKKDLEDAKKEFAKKFLKNAAKYKKNLEKFYKDRSMDGVKSSPGYKRIIETEKNFRKLYPDL